MGQLDKTTEKVNELLDKVDGMPEEVKDGKTPVLETGTTTTLDPGQQATSEVVANGTDDNGNPKYKLNFGIPKGYDGAGGSGGGGTADSVQWANVLNKPSWVNSATKPTYTASEVGALPASTTIPSKTSQLDNDSGFTTSASFKTVNGQSIVGSGNIVIEGGGGGDTPSAGGNVNVTNGSSLQSAGYYAFKPSENGSLEGTFTTIPNASSTADGLMSKEDFAKLGGMKSVLVFPKEVFSLTNESTTEEIVKAFGMKDIELYSLMIQMCSYWDLTGTYEEISKCYINNYECLLGYEYEFKSGNTTATLHFMVNDKGKIKDIAVTTKGTDEFTCVVTEQGGGADDTYYLPIEVYNLSSTSTHEEILEAFGGEEGLKEAIQAVKDGRKLYIYYNISGLTGGIFSVNALFTSSTILKICYHKEYLSDKRLIYIKCNNSDNTQSKVEVIYTKGYSLNSEVYSLTSSSTSDDISAAVGGESGLKAIIQAVNDGNRLVIRGKATNEIQINQDLMCSTYSESDNGDMSLGVYGYGYALFGNLGGFLQIQYTKSSNTFSVQLLSKS